MSNLTRILTAIDAGNSQAADELLPLVYEELRLLAGRRMGKEAPGQTLQPTALVHEAWLRLGGDAQPPWQNRAHFFAAAAEAMRRILIERARRKQAWRHGGGLERLDVTEVEIAAPMREDELLAVNDALERFAAADPPKADLVKLRYFVGLTLQEAGQVLGISEATAVRWWVYSKTWLYREIRSPGGPLGG